MLMATVDPRDSAQNAACGTCCCETINVRPGETNLMVINYAPWAVPIMGKGLGCDPQFDIQQVAACPAPAGSNLPPTAAGPLGWTTPMNTPFNGDRSTLITDPEDDPLTYALVPFQ